MQEAIETFTLKDFKVEIYQMTDDFNPRTEWDNLGTMICNHGRYDLGDTSFNSSLYSSWGEVLAGECGNLNDIIYLPLYLYDHSGITMRTTDFGDKWDSGQVGWIYVKKRDIREKLCIKRITKKFEEGIRERLKSEVAEYDMFLTGDIYEYMITDNEGDTFATSGGYFGSDFKKNGMYENINCDIGDAEVDTAN